MRERHVASLAAALALFAGVACGGEPHGSTSDPLDVVVPVTSSRVVAETVASAPVAHTGCGSLDTILRKRPDSEIKNTLGAIARSAVASFEREQVGTASPSAVVHMLCGSAMPFPSKVPTCGPSRVPDGFFDTPSTGGKDDVGWRCLRFSMGTPISARYGYVKGGPYRGPALGGPNPGPEGFEAWAEEDLDGDGRTKLYTLTGSLEGGTIRIANAVFVSDAD